MMTFYFAVGNLNEVPMANYLDSWMEGSDPAVVDYIFKSTKLSKLIGDQYWTRIEDLSSVNIFNIDVFGVDDSYVKSTYPEFYIPTEVNSFNGQN